MDIDKVAKELDQIKGDNKNILAIVTELKMAVCGSEKIGVPGLIKRVNEHDDYIENDKKRKWMLAGAITAIASIAGSLFSKLFGG